MLNTCFTSAIFRQPNLYLCSNFSYKITVEVNIEIQKLFLTAAEQQVPAES